VIILFSMHDDDSVPLTKAMYALASPRTLLATCRRTIARALMAVAEPVWTAVWWCWWFVSSHDAADTTANDGLLTRRDD
ncbi:MAG: hypothetical protein VYA71_04615, partial [Pseudomonadota bacterium]|nr:hypothetical protein [Pseudomonadota bacterium]